ncbi:MAG: hypothetical protein Q8N53_14900 [Longimicrobiales bacterium]|nr:hypothetical protein [Longimicrobiales bacterium]
MNATPDTPLCPRCGRPPERAGAAAERLSSPQETGDPRPEPVEEDAAREELAGWLAKPEEPEAFSLLGWSLVLLVPFLNVLSLFIAPFTLGLKLFMGVAGLLYVGVVVWYAAGTFPDPFAARDAAMMTGFTTFALYFVALFHSWGVDRKDVRVRRAPAWSRSTERWEHLVYCDACKAVFFDDIDGAPVAVETAPELLGVPADSGRAAARTPIWLWALLAALAVGGGRIAFSMAQEAGRAAEVVPASPELWEDIAPDPVRLDSLEPGDSAGLDEPLIPRRVP